MQEMATISYKYRTRIKSQMQAAWLKACPLPASQQNLTKWTAVTCFLQQYSAVHKTPWPSERIMVARVDPVATEHFYRESDLALPQLAISRRKLLNQPLALSATAEGNT